MTQDADRSNAPRVVLVTAAARGLGLAVARAFKVRGDSVHVSWRSSSAAVPLLQREFGREFVHRVDLARATDAEQLVAEVVALEGRLDVLVHPVGEFKAGSLERATPNDAAHMFESNVTTAMHVFAAARAALRGCRGNALFFGVAGLDSLRGRRDTALYAAAKSALLVLVRSWALEEGAHGVRVNAVSPGVIPHADADPLTLDAKLHARIPLGRAGTPEDIARAALFLCSDEARYVTGVDLPVSGGWLS
ncbi:MAG: SDR family oxidoreductase [Planctomycetota bacterium]|nr:SDR family oxidoreductase [Planctomycetota bacterium]